MKYVGMAWIVVGLMWIGIVIMAAVGVGHPKEASTYLGDFTGGLAMITFLMALGSTTGRNEDDE